MSCKYSAVCPFVHRKNQIDAAKFNACTAQFCQAKQDGCAIYKVIASSSFLKVPADMMPDQSNRVSSILSQNFTNVRI